MKENETKKTYLVAFTMNNACRERRGIEVDDIDDLCKQEVTCYPKNLAEEIIKMMDMEVENYIDEDNKDYLYNPNFIKNLLSVDCGFGDPFVVAIYCVTDNKWIGGDSNSLYDEAIYYGDFSIENYIEVFGKDYVLKKVSLPGFDESIILDCEEDEDKYWDE